MTDAVSSPLKLTILSKRKYSVLIASLVTLSSWVMSLVAIKQIDAHTQGDSHEMRPNTAPYLDAIVTSLIFAVTYFLLGYLSSKLAYCCESRLKAKQDKQTEAADSGHALEEVTSTVGSITSTEHTALLQMSSKGASCWQPFKKTFGQMLLSTLVGAGLALVTLSVADAVYKKLHHGDGHQLASSKLEPMMSISVSVLCCWVGIILSKVALVACEKRRQQAALAATVMTEDFDPEADVMGSPKN